MINITDEAINASEKLILPEGRTFLQEARESIKILESCDILACPGAGKTTVLLSKIDILTNNMPFKDNSGICILSHTNVAVNEIKSRLYYKSSLILNYPNFAGTIQSFVNRFIVFPYLSNLTNNSISVYDNNKYNDELYDTYNTFNLFSLKTVIDRMAVQSPHFGDSKDILSALYIDINTWDLMHNGSKIAGNDKKSCQEFLKLKSILWKKGIISYNDAYLVAFLAISEYPGILDIVSKRFSIVFVDEFQDCSSTQMQLLELIFRKSNTIFQRIGDKDQAIYNSFSDNSSEWILYEKNLYLCKTNRYNQLIANQVSKLKGDNHPIESNVENNNCLKPYILVFSDDKIQNVIPYFCDLIIENNLCDKESPIFKAVGMFKNGETGIKIGSYWDKYEKNDIKTKKKLYFDDYINQLYLVDFEYEIQKLSKIIDSIFLECFNLCGKKTDEGKKYNLTSLNKFLRGSETLKYDGFVLKIANFVFEDIDKREKQSNLKEIITKKILELDFIKTEYIDEFVNSSPTDLENEIMNPFGNVFKYQKNGKNVSVNISTVHGVKGETHTATLYLETEYQRGSDIKRVKSLFEGNQLTNSDLYEKSRRIVYVGISRPTDLLCIAMKKATYQLYKQILDRNEWSIIEL